MFTQPVKGKQFFGREKILSKLEQRVNALKSGYRQNMALTGQMLSGKTSILHHFLECLKDTSLVPIYVEVGDKSFPVFASKFMATLLYAYLQSENLPVSEDMDSLLAQGEKVIPRTAEAIRKIQDDIIKRKYNIAYRELLELTSTLKEETQKPCIVILEEFHNLENYKIKNPFLQLGKIIMIQKSTMYIVSSSQRTTIQKILSEKLSLLFGKFEIIEVSGFGPKTSKFFLNEKISPISINEYYSDYILNLTDRNPFYLDVLLGKIKNIALKSNVTRVNVELLKEALTEVLYAPTGTLYQHFLNQIHFLLEKKMRKKYLNVLFALAEGSNKIKDVAPLIKGDDRILSKILEDLVNLDLVFKSGVFYKIHDTLFAFWLKNIYHKKEASFIDSIHDKSAEFKNFVENDIENYLIEYNQNLLERLRDLFGRFNGELVEIDKKVKKLPKFMKVEVLKYGEDKNYLSCETHKKYWVCKVKQSRVEETDVIDFIQRTYNKTSTARRILIPLKDIDTNALLLAKEKGIWVWKLRSVNSLLRLYNKYDLIVH